MRLEEALPHYRDGKTIVSNDGSKYNTNLFEATLCINQASEAEMLGEWTIREEPKPPKRISPALCYIPDDNLWWIPDSLYESAEQARANHANFHSWPALDGNGQPITVLVPQEGK